MKNKIKQQILEQSVMLNKSMAWWENEILEISSLLETLENSNAKKSVINQTITTHKALFARGNMELGICEDLDNKVKNFIDNEKKKK
tara:strand:+ start:136 stop:396 length:261 start_codon:yes stop_codon:yes gene_type:complete